MNQVCNSLLTPTPPMGWNSWDCFGLDVNEAEVKQNAEFMAKHLKQYGWEYIVVDLGWYAPGVSTTNYKSPRIPYLIDEYGRLIPEPGRFPSSADGSGFTHLAAYVHGLGLKFGIHIMRGMPWKAADEKKTIKGTDISCSDICDPNDMCLWYGSQYGIDCTKKGAQEYYDSIIELYKSWGVDFIKADDMGSWDGDGLNSPYRVDEVEALATAINKNGNDIVLSLSPGAAYLGNAYHLSRHAHMWRISADFWDNWEALKRQFPRCEAWSKRKVAGHWPDADMLPLGRIGIRGEVGSARNTNFTKDEQITLMTLWCMFRSPLMFGGHLPESDEFTLSLLTNREVIAINQFSRNNKQISANDELIIWGATNQTGDVDYIALFNISDAEKEITYPVNPHKEIRELWSIDRFSEVAEIRLCIPAHGCKLLKIF
jgi:alpha-galactosidase